MNTYDRLAVHYLFPLMICGFIYQGPCRYASMKEIQLLNRDGKKVFVLKCPINNNNDFWNLQPLNYFVFNLIYYSPNDS